MKAVSRFSLLLAVGLVTCAAFAASAQAVEINPAGTLITGTADNPTLNYGSQVVQCDTGTAIGTTGDPASDVVDVEVQFQSPCSIQPVGLNASTTCANGDFTRLRALTSDTNLGEVDELLTGFQCQVVVLGVCTITVGPQQLPISGGTNAANLLNEGSNGSETIAADVDVNATNNNSLCGPTPSGTGGFAGNYVLDTAVSFD